jgi:hypothetical protein
MAFPLSNGAELEEGHEESGVDDGANAADSGVSTKFVPKSGTENAA